MRLSGSGLNLGYSQIASSQNGKIGLPVANNSVLYSHYKHVQGYSAKDNSRAVPISKIRILNNLIENLSKMKSRTLNTKLPDLNKISSETVNSMIDTYSKELHRVVSAAQTGFNATETGLVVSMTV